MALYTRRFVKPYPGGYVDKPQKTTPVTAAILNMQDETFSALEDFLTSEDVSFKKSLTIGYRAGSSGIGTYSLVVGNGKSSGIGTILIGTGQVNGSYSCAFGTSHNVSGDYALAAGNSCTASAMNTFAAGYRCTATADSDHAEGYGTTASGMFSHAENNGSKSSGIMSHAEGSSTEAKGAVSHAEGDHTIAAGTSQHAQGRYNIEDSVSKYAHIVGNGRYNTETKEYERSNAHTLDWVGNAWFAGDVTNGNGVSLDSLMELIGTTGQLRTIVETLPEDNISTNTIYMVLKESGGENDIYDEYINVDGTPYGWEFIGNSAIDLSDYYTKSQVDDILSGYVPTETGKGLSSNDYTYADRELVESIRNMTAEDAMAILNNEVA